jgi:hypothetical protein
MVMMDIDLLDSPFQYNVYRLYVLFTLSQAMCIVCMYHELYMLHVYIYMYVLVMPHVGPFLIWK